MDAGPDSKEAARSFFGGANGAARPSPRQQIINGTASTGKARTVMLKISEWLFLPCSRNL